MDNGLQKSPMDENAEKSRYCQALEVLKALESVESVEPLALPRKRISLSTVSDVRGKEYIQMRKSEAVASVTQEQYRELVWYHLEELFPGHLKEYEHFMDTAFKALTWFVLYLYEEEFFDDIADPMTVDDCRTLFEFIYGTENPKKALSELGIYLDKFRNIREPDIGNIIEWYTKVASSMPEELPCFTSRTLYHPQPLHRGDHQYVCETRKIIEQRKHGLEREVMRHLMMELNEGKCFCIIDALYLEAWKRIPIASLGGGFLEEDMLDILASGIHRALNDIIKMRTTRLCKDRDLVKATLSLFGSCDDDVRQVVEWADLERRTQRRRFINKDDLFTSLYQNILGGDGFPFGRIEYLRSSDVDTKNDRTVYQVYQRSEVIARKEGKQNIGLEHLYKALMNERVDNESSWDKFKIWVRMTMSKNKHKTGADAQLWRKIHNNSGDGAREFKTDYLTVVRNIQDDNFTPLKDVIASVLPKDVVLGKGFPEKNTKLHFVLRS
ncbi:hypothetical protein OROHE_002273 [Orobanche hederae]